MTTRFLSLWGLLVASLAVAQEPKAADEPPKAGPLRWLTSLSDAYVHAQRQKQPILVRVGSEACVWCGKLEKELAKPNVQEELARWTLVVLEAGKLGKDGRTLTVGAVPALRLLTATGRVVAARDGYLPADRLVAWLQEHHDKAAVAVGAELVGNEAPPAAILERLLALLKHRDPSLREAAIRRLLPHREVAAGPVVEAFAGANLQTRLTALELLRDWKAPVGKLDPWQPESLTEERLQELRKWAADVKPGPAAVALTPELLPGVRRDLVRLAEAPESEAAAIRERLARFGSALMPEVQTHFKQAESDAARERLTAMRYRLLATSALALDWPGGLDRLASNQPAVRQEAAHDLLTRVTVAEEPLLLELFASGDLQVRELSLRALLNVARRDETTVLARLLALPEADTRVVVLQHMARRPDRAFVPALRDYLARETDPDLLIHTARVLRVIEGREAAGLLKQLLRHDTWRVRAAAVEDLAENIHYGRAALSSATQVDLYAALVERLRDDEVAVVGRAVKALKRVGLPSLLTPLVQAAEARPEVAVDVIDALMFNPELKVKVVPTLRKFCAHPDRLVRTVAIRELCGVSADVEQELRTLLKDPDAGVRTAAAQAVLKLLDSTNSSYPEVADEEAAAELDDVLNKERAGKGRPGWIAGLTELLLPLLDAESADERVAAAVPLVALGREDKALPILRAAAKLSPLLYSASAVAIGWLPWEPRLAYTRELLELQPGSTELTAVAKQLVRVRDPRTVPLLWKMAERPELTPEGAGYLLRCLRFVHLGDSGGSSRRPISAALAKRVAAAVRPRAESGPELSRLIALAVLATADEEEAQALATKIVADDQAPAELRGDALQVLLVTQPHAVATRLAGASLKHPAAPVRRQALLFLTSDVAATAQLIRSGKVDLDLGSSPPNAKSWTPEPPRGLRLDMVKPLLADPDPEFRGRAGYLAVLLNDPAGLEPLIRHWRERARYDEAWVQLVVRAIAALGDDTRVPILEEIYRGYEAGSYQGIAVFYWTIRGMDGPNAQRLRKLIRQEIGMERLR